MERNLDKKFTLDPKKMVNNLKKMLAQRDQIYLGLKEIFAFHEISFSEVSNEGRIEKVVIDGNELAMLSLGTVIVSTKNKELSFEALVNGGVCKRNREKCTTNEESTFVFDILLPELVKIKEIGYAASFREQKIIIFSKKAPISFTFTAILQLYQEKGLEYLLDAIVAIFKQDKSHDDLVKAYLESLDDGEKEYSKALIDISRSTIPRKSE